ncbi:MAG: helix-turn-helix domain-containing protein [Synechococcus sp.]
MASSRLTDSQKKELAERYCAGEASSALAEAFGCSVNTVSRTVRTLLPTEEYNAIKAARAKGGWSVAATVAADDAPSPVASSIPPGVPPTQDPAQAELELMEPEPSQQSLALDDADQFGADQSGDADDRELEQDAPDQDLANQFHEVAILTGITHADSHVPVTTQPLEPGVLPESAYMLVDKVVELDPRPLSDFPELGSLDPADQERQAICLFASPRTAKRQCGRNQRVIRVPDTSVFTRTSSYLLARGITRLVLEGSLIALDG